MLDFTFSLYLGLRHPHCVLEPWESLTTGAPATLVEPPVSRVVAQAAAKLQGCERGLLSPSTLYLFWDLFSLLGRESVAIYLDAGTYPIVRWGAERAAGRGVAVREFPHHNAVALDWLLRHHARAGVVSLIVTDGFCPACGRAAPIREYLACARAFGGLLIIDDTQALGILGHSQGPAAPYGKGGGGVLRWSGVSGSEIVVVSSLTKGFGAPLAVISGSSALIGRFEAASETRVHCSPPSAASVHAAHRALTVNDQMGDTLRYRLAGLVSRFRHLLGQQGVSLSGGLFPMQTLPPLPGLDAATLHQQLLREGIKTVLHRRRGGNLPLVSFIITASHTENDIEKAAETLAYLWGRNASGPSLERMSRQKEVRQWF
ncbi:MAG: aminotransferase class I/II [Geobacter sp.]|nr:MAG: aminotransferase class I/II [Geobacter sp.]